MAKDKKDNRPTAPPIDPSPPPESKTPPKDPEVDSLQLLLGYDLKINDFMTLHQPTVGDIAEFGERRYFAMVSTLCAIPSDMKSVLWDLQVDWNEFSDFELFIMTSHGYTAEDTRLILGDINLSDFRPVKYQPDDSLEEEIALCDSTNTLLIKESDYLRFAAALREIHGFKMKREKAGNRYTRDILIEEDRQKIARNKNKPYESILTNLVGAMLVYPGFAYKGRELRDIGIYEFMSDVKHAQVYTSTVALMHGLQCGFRDSKGIKTEDLNWLRSVD